MRGWVGHYALMSASEAILTREPSEIRALPSNVEAEAAFLGAVLDFLLEADRRVIAFCDSAALPYTAPMQARAALPGGREWHWT